MSSKHNDSISELLIVLGLAVTLWHALRRAWYWMIRTLHHLLPLIPWQLVAWVAGPLLVIGASVVAIYHRFHRGRSVR